MEWLPSVLIRGCVRRLVPHPRIKYWAAWLLLFLQGKSTLTNEINSNLTNVSHNIDSKRISSYNSRSVDQNHPENTFVLRFVWGAAFPVLLSLLHVPSGCREGEILLPLTHSQGHELSLESSPAKHRLFSSEKHYLVGFSSGWINMVNQYLTRKQEVI